MNPTCEHSRQLGSGNIKPDLLPGIQANGPRGIIRSQFQTFSFISGRVGRSLDVNVTINQVFETLLRVSRRVVFDQGDPKIEGVVASRPYNMANGENPVTRCLLKQ